MKDNDYSVESYLLEIRKDICAAVNDSPNKYYGATDHYLEWYLEKNGIPVEQVYMSKKLYVSRIKAINLMGKHKLFQYYEQGTIPPTCVE